MALLSPWLPVFRPASIFGRSQLNNYSCVAVRKSGGFSGLGLVSLGMPGPGRVPLGLGAVTLKVAGALLTAKRFREGVRVTAKADHDATGTGTVEDAGLAAAARILLLTLIRSLLVVISASGKDGPCYRRSTSSMQDHM
jgi:hypothetical protein